ncbi:MAG: YybS family protein [Oscillospiraceae bacterium]|jgi:hypothetical protein|nr:YybS family protein [Oscillospiraceae bacterium]
MRWIRDSKRIPGLIAWTAGLGCVGAFAAPAIAFPMIAMALPAITLSCMRSVGWLAAFTGTAALSIGLGVATAPWVAFLPILILLPPIALRFTRFPGKWSLPQRFVAAMACLCLCAIAALAVIWRQMGASPVQAAVDALETWLAESNQGSEFLLSAYRYGLARMPEGAPFAMQIGQATWVMPSHARELTNSLLFTVQALLSQYMPGWIVSGAAVGAAMLVSVSISMDRDAEIKNGMNKYSAAEKSAGDENSGIGLANSPQFSEWRFTEGFANYLLAASATLIALNLITVGRLAAAALVGSAVFQSILALQGAAVLESMLKKRSVPNIVRKVLIGLCFVIFGMVCFLLGIADALFDVRRLRTADERSGNP